ncbi:MAG: hypothetical protein GF364_06660 [Candidatus Lokiarchaeota archaeon]|nr:hypothetical protein [Candidatus Lokiarchaeota archaeon]
MFSRNFIFLNTKMYCMKKEIKPFQLAEKSIKKNLILATKLDDKVNIMTLGWKTIGTLWSKPVWIVAVKPSRFTYDMINKSKDFTLHLFSKERSDVVDLSGMASGRNTDKIKELGLTLKKSNKVNTPLIEEAEISYECRIIHTAESGNNAEHRLYFGHILAAYAEEGLLN